MILQQPLFSHFSGVSITLSTMRRHDIVFSSYCRYLPGFIFRSTEKTDWEDWKERLLQFFPRESWLWCVFCWTNRVELVSLVNLSTMEKNNKSWISWADKCSLRIGTDEQVVPDDGQSRGSLDRGHSHRLSFISEMVKQLVIRVFRSTVPWHDSDRHRLAVCAVEKVGVASCKPTGTSTIPALNSTMHAWHIKEKCLKLVQIWNYSVHVNNQIKNCSKATTCCDECCHLVNQKL